MDCGAVRVCFVNELSGDVCEYDKWVISGEVQDV